MLGELYPFTIELPEAIVQCFGHGDAPPERAVVVARIGWYSGAGRGKKKIVLLEIN